MRWLTFEIQREPGFRFNLTDLLLVTAVLAATVGWASVFRDQHLYLLPLYVGGSFFLFCNVFRIGNRMEPPWYLTFVAITVYGFTLPEFPWLLLLVACETIRWGLIGYCIWRGPYRGAFHRQVERWRAAGVSR